jgi:hypothetical protein
MLSTLPGITGINLIPDKDCFERDFYDLYFQTIKDIGIYIADKKLNIRMYQFNTMADQTTRGKCNSIYITKDNEIFNCNTRSVQKIKICIRPHLILKTIDIS